jgi:hypothetical protein
LNYNQQHDSAMKRMFWSTRKEAAFAYLAYLFSCQISLGDENSALAGVEIPIPSAMIEAASWGDTLSLISKFLMPPPKAINGTCVS